MTATTPNYVSRPPDESDEGKTKETKCIELQRRQENDGPTPAMEEQNEKDEDNSSDDKGGGSEKGESSSSDGKGASGGSGGGYQADDDCSSSESSVGKNGEGSSGDGQDGSRSDCKALAVDPRTTNALPENVDDEPVNRSATRENDPNSYGTSDSGSRNSSKEDCYVHSHKHYHRPRGKPLTQVGQATLPQWNGIRIQHPMDPRIDFSCVGYFGAPMHQAGNIGLPSSPQSSASLKYPPLACKVDANSTSAIFSAPKNTESSTNDHTMPREAPPVFPSFEQYMKLMESVRPFFHAHGISSEKAMHEAMRSDEPNSSERTSSELPTGSSDSDQRPSVADLLDVTRNINQNWSLHHHDLAMNATRAAVAARNEPQGQNHAEPKKSKEGGEDNSDSSSMVVLARTKRKHQDGARDGAPNNESSISNTSNSEGSATSSEKRVHIQHPQHLEVVGAANADASDDDRIAVDDHAGDDSNDRDENLEESHRDSDRPDGQPEGSSSSSSSGDRNNGEAPGGAVQYGVPAVVSEYSSSNRNSSGENNGNPLSTSGSGSGGNTGSGTGSGSNQGGSSGSGNDQGIGTGSSGSGNDAKGSSEEMMDISGENNSGENSVENSDSSNKETALVNSKDAPAGSPGNAPHRHPSDSIHHSHYHQHLSGANSPPTHSMDQGDENAVRERKIQDKKRKRMNMRREYEEKVEQEMEYSETSCEKEVVIRPGKPVTLDKVLSFTKIPRLVVKAGPPFLVVYTNASYCRLSGIDSHIAVGKPVTNLLSLPDLNELSQLDVENVPGVTEMSTKEAHGDRKAEINSSPAAQGSQDHLDRTQNHSAAAAAGRARAAASSREDNQEIGLEPLIAASGFGRLQIINVRAKPHHMMGRNIKVIKTAIGQRRNHEERSNAGSSITSSYDGPQHFVPCTMSISPVVSLPDAYNAIVVTDKEKSDTSYHHKIKRFEKDNESNPIIKSKRRKQHHHHQHGEDFFQHHSVRTNHSMKEVSKHHHLITHYVIQLEPFDGDFRNFGTLESQSSASTSVEAQLMGMTQAEVRRNRMRKAVKMETSNDRDKALADTADGGGDDDDEEIPSEDVSETKQHVSAVG